MPAFSNGFSQGFDADPSVATPDPFLGIPIETLRQHAGLMPNDASQDAQIEAAFSITVQVVSDYLDRILPYGVYTESEIHFSGSAMHLKAYPLDIIDVLVSNDAQEPLFHFEKNTGVIKLDGHKRYHELSCSYRGGYVKLPGTLAMVVLATFDVVWASLSASSGSAVVGKEIRATVVDGMRVEYFDPNANSATSSAEFGLIPGSMISMLEPYRRKFA